VTPLFFTLFVAPAALALFGFIAGLLGARFPKAPWIGTATIVLAYLAAIAAWGGWARNCTDCEAPDSDSTRGSIAAAALVFGLFETLALICIVWIAALVPDLIKGVRYWARPR
jgi:hypothetical protein